MKPARNVVVLAPMPLELAAVTSAFGLHLGGEGLIVPWAGQVGESAMHAACPAYPGMGPARTRTATARLLEEGFPGGGKVDHVMIAGICGGLDPALPVGTVINPAVIVDHSSGLSYKHCPPGDAALQGANWLRPRRCRLTSNSNHSLFADGCLAVDMESAAVAEVCEPRGVPWSVYRCISDRHVDGLLDARVVALTNPDGTLDRRCQIERLPEGGTRRVMVRASSSWAVIARERHS